MIGETPLGPMYRWGLTPVCLSFFQGGWGWTVCGGGGEGGGGEEGYYMGVVMATSIDSVPASCMHGNAAKKA